VTKVAPTELLNHPRNALIEFLPEPHEYYFTCLNGEKKQFKGATSLIGDYTNYFDRNKISKGVAARDGKSQQQVLDEWAENNKVAIDLGNYVHDALENFVKTGEIVDDALISSFVRSYESMGLTPLAAEWTIFDETIERASSIDGNFLAPDGRYVIVDYKTNRKGVDYDSYKDQRMVFPLQGLYDSKYSSYSLQVSLYWHWVEKYYMASKDISDLHYILWIGQDHNGWVFDWMPALDLRKEIELIYADLSALTA